MTRVVAVALLAALGACTSQRDIVIEDSELYARIELQCVGWCRVIDVAATHASGSGVVDEMLEP